MAGPHLPLDVDPLVRQVDGENDTTDVYQTHRGKQPTTHGDHGQPPRPAVPNTHLRYAQD